MQPDELEYVGFWPRVGASIIDGVLLGVIIWPILTALYGASYWSSEKIVQGPMDFILSWVFPAVVVILFWVEKQATPGKMAISAKIVDAKTGSTPTTGQFIGRYFSYFLAGLPLGLGIIWVAFDDRKQGWHDKLAGTVVVRQKNRQPRPVSRYQEAIADDLNQYDDKFFAIALKEIESNSLNKATWAKALAMSDGNSEKCNSIYIKLRVKYFQELQKKRTNNTNIKQSCEVLIDPDKSAGHDRLIEEQEEKVKQQNGTEMLGVTGEATEQLHDQTHEYTKAQKPPPPRNSRLEELQLILKTPYGIGLIAILVTIFLFIVIASDGRLKQLTQAVNSAENISQHAKDLYEQGRYAEALPLYQYLAEKGDAKAQTRLGSAYAYGKGVSQNYTQAVYWYRKAAEQGYAMAQYSLGIVYTTGQGVAQDYSQAVYWYRKAAEQGDSSAQFNLGAAYRDGHGVVQDNNQAVYWFRKAAEQGDASAQTSLGQAYAKGFGVEQNYSQAVNWYKRAVEQGDEYAQFELGVAYQIGQGVVQDYNQAVYLFRKAAEQGNEFAIEELKKISRSESPRTEASAPMVAILKAAKNADSTMFRDAYSARIRQDNEQSDWEKNLTETQATLKRKFGDYQITDFTFSFEGDDAKGKLEVSFKGKAQFALAVVKDGTAWKLDQR